MAQHPTDMRMGVNCLSGQVRMVGLDPSNGDVYIFVGKSRQVMKILHWEHGGYVVYYKRLEEGRFHPRIFSASGRWVPQHEVVRACASDGRHLSQSRPSAQV